MNKREMSFQEVDDLDLLKHGDLIAASNWFVKQHQERFNEEPTFAVAGTPVAAPPMRSPLPISETSFALWTLVIGRLHALGLKNDELQILAQIIEPNLPTMPLAGRQAMIVTDGLYALFMALADYLYSLVGRAKVKKQMAHQQRQTLWLQVIGILSSLIIAYGVASIVVSTARIESSSLQPIIVELQKLEGLAANSDTGQLKVQLQDLIELEKIMASTPENFSRKAKP